MSCQSNNLASYIWTLADLLRGDFKQSQYGRIILPFTLLHRLECVLEETKNAVLAEAEKVQKPEPSSPIRAQLTTISASPKADETESGEDRNSTALPSYWTFGRCDEDQSSRASRPKPRSSARSASSARQLPPRFLR